jgi:predicted dehydrogenase
MLNLAQIGVGYWGPNLLRNLVVNPSCTVKTVVDLSEERREFVSSHYPSIETKVDAEDIIHDESIDGIIIATPVSTHFDLAMKSLKAGKHILVEKPLATSVDQVKQIGALAKEKNLVAMVGHTFLFNEAVLKVKEIIDTGKLGDIRYIYSQRVNLGRIRNDVDALWNLAPHDISIVQYWLNEPQPISISRRGMDYVQNGVDDVVFMNIEYPKNVMANIHVSWLDPHKIRRMTVVGSKKMVVYDDIAKNKITIYDKGIDRMAVLGERMDFDDPSTYLFNHRDGDVTIPRIKWVEPLKNEIAHFFDCIQNGTDCITDASHAEGVVRILGAAG